MVARYHLHIGPFVHLRLQYRILGQRSQAIILYILETRIVSHEAEAHIVYRTVTMLGHDNLGQSAKVITTLILVYLIVFRAMDKTYDIGILLDGTRFTQVRHHRAFIRTLLYCAGQL